MDMWRHVKNCKCILKKCFDSRGDPHIALQIQMTSLGQGLPSPTTMLFNYPMRGIMPIINRPPVGIDNDEKHHKVLIIRETKNDKGKDTSVHFVSIPIESTVAVQWEEGGLWTHDIIEGKGDQNHHDKSYHIHITKTGRLVTQNRQHLKPTQISAEQYLWGQLHKHTKTDPIRKF